MNHNNIADAISWQTASTTNILKNQDKQFIELVLIQLKKIPEVKAVLLVGSRASQVQSKGADFDFLVVHDWKDTNIQTIHCKIHERWTDFILLQAQNFREPTRQGKRIICHLMKQYAHLYSDKELTDLLAKDFTASISPLSNHYEIESIWYWIRANIEKAKKNFLTDRDFANTLLVEAYYFIGLFYERLMGQECCGISHSLRYMQKTNKTLWEKYKSFFQQKNKLKYLINLIKLLPYSEECFNDSPLVELNNFISTFPFYDANIQFEPKPKRELGQLIRLLNNQ